MTVAAHGLGGMQDHTHDLARGLVAAGHEVEVIAARHPEGVRYEERYGAQWHYVDAPAYHERLPRHHRDWLRGSHRAFVERHHSRPFDVIHSESSSALELVRRGVPHTVPFTALIHGSFLGLARAQWNRARNGDLRAKVREAKGFVWMCGLYTQRGECVRFRPYDWMVPSHKIFDDVVRARAARRSHGHVVPNGIDVTRFRPRDRQAVRRELGLEDGPLLVSVGRLNVEKGMDLAIRATAEVNGNGAPARLVLVGDGEERASLERVVDELGVRERVTFVGAQPHERVAAYMAAADVFLFPTLRDEAAPLVLPQAMACAAPVIASDIGGITEVVETDGRNGILIPPGNQEALVAAVRRLLHDPDQRRALGDAGRRRVEAEYTIERMVERSLEVYETACRRLAARSR